MNTVLVVWINCPSPEVAEDLSKLLIGARLVAATNLHPAVESRYHWQGEVVVRTEFPLTVKTKACLFGAVERAVLNAHPYATPSIVAHSMRASASYCAWIAAETIDPNATAERTDPNRPTATHPEEGTP